MLQYVTKHRKQQPPKKTKKIGKKRSVILDGVQNVSYPSIIVSYIKEDNTTKTKINRCKFLTILLLHNFVLWCFSIH
jgi:hypothetical protein